MEGGGLVGVFDLDFIQFGQYLNPCSYAITSARSPPKISEQHKYIYSQRTYSRSNTVENPPIYNKTT